LVVCILDELSAHCADVNDNAMFFSHLEVTPQDHCQPLWRRVK
jgi:hypothetical protein